VIIVFARAPLPGRVKTRLVPRSASGRARLQRGLRGRRCAPALTARAERWNCTDARARHPFFLKCREDFKLRLQEQRGRDLGERMYRALAAALRRYRGTASSAPIVPSCGRRTCDARRGCFARLRCRVAHGGWRLRIDRRAPHFVRCSTASPGAKRRLRADGNATARPGISLARAAQGWDSIVPRTWSASDRSALFQRSRSLRR